MKIDGPAIGWKQIQFDWIKFKVTRDQDGTSFDLKPKS